MASRFFGRFDHSLDSKGRVILPARFRAAFDATAFISAHDAHCLALWTPEGFDVEFDKVMALMDRSPEDREFARRWSSRTSEEKIDAQGRILIPAGLRAYAGLELDSPVVVNGSMDRIELWSAERWADIDPADDSLADGSWRLQHASSSTASSSGVNEEQE